MATPDSPLDSPEFRAHVDAINDRARRETEERHQRLHPTPSAVDTWRATEGYRRAGLALDMAREIGELASAAAIPPNLTIGSKEFLRPFRPEMWGWIIRQARTSTWPGDTTGTLLTERGGLYDYLFYNKPLGPGRRLQPRDRVWIGNEDYRGEPTGTRIYGSEYVRRMYEHDFIQPTGYMDVYERALAEFAVVKGLVDS